MAKPTRPTEPKRPHIILRFYDVWWKSILMDLFLEFLELCHPELYKLIDKSKPITFYDKEFPRLYLSGKGKRRHADLIAKVHLITGEEVSIIVHVEAQGYPDAEFPYRMEVYNYRGHDRHQLPVESIALLTDDDPDFRPNEYRKKVVTTERILKFKSIKLMDFKPKQLQKSGKLFAIAIEAAWYGLKQNKLKDEGLMAVKLDLLRRLSKRKVPPEKIAALMHFIRLIVPFEEPANSAIFEAEFEKQQSNRDMESINLNPHVPQTVGAYLKMKELEFKEAMQKQERRFKALLKKNEEEKAERKKAEAERLLMQQKAEAERQLMQQKAEAERQLMQQKAEAERQRAAEQAETAIKILLENGFEVSYICEKMKVSQEQVSQIQQQLLADK